jgi:hypothetical protein
MYKSKAGLVSFILPFPSSMMLYKEEDIEKPRLDIFSPKTFLGIERTLIVPLDAVGKFL